MQVRLGRNCHTSSFPLLSQILSEPAYNQLRTKEQLG